MTPPLAPGVSPASPVKDVPSPAKDITMITVQDTAPVAEVTGPEPAIADPPRRERPRLRRALRVIRSATVVLVLLAGAAVGGTYVVQRRLAAQAFVNVGTAVLTAQPMPIGSADAGVVTDILVKERQSVTAGASVAKITLPPNGTSKEPRTQTLKAPAAGIVTDVAVDVGGVARPGEPVITLYDPTKLTFLAEVPLDKLRQLRLGMTTYVDGAGLDHRVATTLQDVVPQVGTDPTPADNKLTVVLVPDRSEMATVQRLVPGLRFDAVADTKTAPGGIQAVNSA